MSEEKSIGGYEYVDGSDPVYKKEEKKERSECGGSSKYSRKKES